MFVSVLLFMQRLVLKSFRWRRLVIGATIIGATAASYLYFFSSGSADIEGRLEHRQEDLVLCLPSREKQLSKLKSNTLFDVLVIGGGSVGAGVALDATTRGLQVALVEREDFASGTSSRSTKLIHGGVRYLEKAILELDPKQLMLVFDALHERKTFFTIAPNLVRKLPIMSPCYSWWDIPYYWAGLQLYDFLSGRSKLGRTRWLSKNESIHMFPTLSKENLKGTVIYYDGQMDDSRMNVTLALSAASHGATVANYVEAVDLIKEVDTKTNKVKVVGAKVRDNLRGDSWEIRAKVVVNATGAFADTIRQMENLKVPRMILPSAGAHIILPDYYSPNDMGLIIPKTKDGRVIFMLPWLGKTLVGTTDSVTELTPLPKPHENEVQFILDEISRYLCVPVKRGDIVAAWSGIRPLVQQKIQKADTTEKHASEKTSAISRDHVIELSEGGLVTIAGGKWTTYRKMAQDTVDKIIELGNFSTVKACQTDRLALVGARGWDRALFCELAQNYRLLIKTTRGTQMWSSMTSDIAHHLSNSYGTRAFLVAELAQQGYGKRLADGYPYLEAEVVYCAQHEYACTAIDILARRTRLAFLDPAAALQALPKVVELMAESLQWSSKRKKQETELAIRFLQTMTIQKIN